MNIIMSEMEEEIKRKKRNWVVEESKGNWTETKMVHLWRWIHTYHIKSMWLHKLYACHTTSPNKYFTIYIIHHAVSRRNWVLFHKHATYKNLQEKYARNFSFFFTTIWALSLFFTLCFFESCLLKKKTKKKRNVFFWLCDVSLTLILRWHSQCTCEGIERHASCIH